MSHNFFLYACPIVVKKNVPFVKMVNLRLWNCSCSVSLQFNDYVSQWYMFNCIFPLTVLSLSPSILYELVLTTVVITLIILLSKSTATYWFDCFLYNNLFIKQLLFPCLLFLLTGKIFWYIYIYPFSLIL